MNKAVVMALVAMLGMNMVATASAREQSDAVLQDFKRHQAKNNKNIKHHNKKKTAKIERVPMAKLRNCHVRKFWVAPSGIREAKVCEVVK